MDKGLITEKWWLGWCLDSTSAQVKGEWSLSGLLWASSDSPNKLGIHSTFVKVQNISYASSSASPYFSLNFSWYTQINTNLSFLTQCLPIMKPDYRGRWPGQSDGEKGKTAARPHDQMNCAWKRYAYKSDCRNTTDPVNYSIVSGPEAATYTPSSSLFSLSFNKASPMSFQFWNSMLKGRLLGSSGRSAGWPWFLVNTAKIEDRLSSQPLCIRSHFSKPATWLVLEGDCKLPRWLQLTSFRVLPKKWT